MSISQIETPIAECLECGYSLLGITPSDSARCPECGCLVQLSEQMSSRIDQISWQMCEKLRRGVDVFCIGIAVMVLSFFFGLIASGLPWLWLGGISIGIIVATVGIWKLSSYYRHRENAAIPLYLLRTSVVLLATSLASAIILMLVTIPSVGLTLLRDPRWNIVWYGILIGIVFSLGLTCWMLLHLLTRVSNRFSGDKLGAGIRQTRMLTILLGVGFVGLFLWNSLDPAPYNSRVFDFKVYQTFCIFLGLLSLIALVAWGNLIYALRRMLKAPEEASAEKLMRHSA